MATHRIPILQAINFDATGDCFMEPYSIKSTNAVMNHMVTIFNDAVARTGLSGKFDVPQNYVGSANLIIHWTSTAIVGTMPWDFDYRAVGGDDAESLDQATFQESVSQNDTAPTVAHNRMTATLNLTDGNFAAGDTVEFFLARPTGGAMAAAAILHDALFEYADT